MQNNIRNRGRPSKAAIAARPEPVPAPPVDVPVKGLVCPCCGRAMVPSRLRTLPDGSTYNKCKLCAGRFKVFAGPNGFPMASVITHPI